MKVILAAATMSVVVLVGAVSTEPTIRAAEEPVAKNQKPEPRAVVSRSRHYPDRYKRRRVRFVPWARPSVRQVHRIIAYEAVRWGVPAARITRRIYCESKFDWSVINGGGYGGLGQFAESTFWRGVTTMPTKVKVKSSRIVRRHTIKVVRFADGSVRHRRGFTVPVRRTRILVGHIRVGGNRLHGFAQVRIVAQALAGRSAVSSGEWSCPA